MPTPKRPTPDPRSIPMMRQQNAMKAMQVAGLTQEAAAAAIAAVAPGAESTWRSLISEGRQGKEEFPLWAFLLILAFSDPEQGRIMVLGLVQACGLPLDVILQDFPTDPASASQQEVMAKAMRLLSIAVTLAQSEADPKSGGPGTGWIHVQDLARWLNAAHAADQAIREAA